MQAARHSYKSPVRPVIYGRESVPSYHAGLFANLKDKLLIQGEETVVLDGIFYTVAELEEIEKGLDEESWQNHVIIYNNKGLLLFLEEQVVDTDKLNAAYYYRFKPSFVQFISPFFAQVFYSLSLDWLRSNLPSLCKLMDFTGFVALADAQQAYEPLRSYFRSLQEFAEGLEWDEFVRDETVLAFIFSPYWRELVNKLPPALESSRIGMAESLLSLAKRFEGNATPAYLQELAASLKGLQLPVVLKEEIGKYAYSLSRYNAESFKVVKKRGSNPSFYVIAGLACFFGILLFTYFNTSRRKNNA
ncbi:MAG TPA: hypothetical protein VFR58_00340, partial [Flavisolibacter sp.]|nr:hypothetical protein [Flavisolibacter sp.]